MPEAKEGICPKCGGELNYEAGETVETEYAYPIDCRSCDFTGKEWYSMKFNGQTDDMGNDV